MQYNEIPSLKTTARKRTAAYIAQNRYIKNKDWDIIFNMCMN